MSAVSPHTLSIQTTLQIVDSKLQDLGSGPHTPSQAEEHKKLTIHKQKLVQQMKGLFQMSFQLFKIGFCCLILNLLIYVMEY